MNCAVCREPIDGMAVDVGRLDIKTNQLKRFFIHPECFLEKFEEFKEKAEKGGEMDFEKEDMPRTAEKKVVSAAEEKEKRIEHYKQTAYLDIQKAQAEKEGVVWLCMVNDPASYYAVRQIISLKGIDMSVDQFEELAAIFIQLTRKAILRASTKSAQMPMPEVK